MAKSLPAEQVPGIYRRDLGEFRIATVHDGMLGASFEDVVGVKPETWEAAHRADLTHPRRWPAPCASRRRQRPDGPSHAKEIAARRP